MTPFGQLVLFSLSVLHVQSQQQYQNQQHYQHYHQQHAQNHALHYHAQNPQYHSHAHAGQPHPQHQHNYRAHQVAPQRTNNVPPRTQHSAHHVQHPPQHATQQQPHAQVQHQQHAQAQAAQQARKYNQVSAYHTNYPHPSLNQPTHQVCDIPPDLWCDSAEAAQQCGVQRQCDELRQRTRPIKISLIYEALCPYCQKFISNQLGTIFNQYRNQIELELIPWGNARILRDGSFSCNHGKKECDANRMQSCVLDILKVKGALPFIVCFERAIQHTSVEPAFNQCSAFVRTHTREIRHCYDGERGIQLQRVAAQKTMSTRPHQILEVPYININDYTPNVDNNNLNVMILPQLLNKWTKIYHKV